MQPDRIAASVQGSQIGRIMGDMQSFRKRIVSLPTALVLAAIAGHVPSASGQNEPSPAEVTDEAAEGPRIVFSARPHWALHMLARAEAGREGGATRVPELAALAQAVSDAAGSDRVWLIADAALLGTNDLEVRDWLGSLPLDRVAGAKAEGARAALGAYLRALASALPDYSHEEWRDTEQRLAERGEAIRRELAGSDATLLADTLAALGLRGAGPARVGLVPVAPSPGAVTYRTKEGPVSVVGEEGLDDDTLLEVTLHEAIHAFDSMATGERDDVLALLRRALLEAGLDERDPRFRNAWHCLFFVHAAEMVRRAGRPDYTDYGERSGVYERTGEVAGLMREAWAGVLDGELAVEQFAREVARRAHGG